MNNEAPAGQVVPHAHIHVIPRNEKDGLVHWPHSLYKDETEASSIAEKISTELEIDVEPAV